MAVGDELADAFATVEAQGRQVHSVTLSPEMATCLHYVIHRDPKTGTSTLWGATVFIDPRATTWAVGDETPTQSLMHNPHSLMP